MKPLRGSLLLLVSATTLFHLADSSVVSNTQACSNGNCAQAGSGGGSDDWPEWMRNGGSPPGIPGKRAAYEEGSIKRAARGVHIENRRGPSNCAGNGCNGFPKMPEMNMNMPKMDMPKFDNNNNNQAGSSISNGDEHNNVYVSTVSRNSVEQSRPQTNTVHSSSSNDDVGNANSGNFGYPDYKIESVNGDVEAAKEKVAKAFAESAKNEKPFGDDEASAPSNDDFIENVIKHRKPIQIERRPIVQSSSSNDDVVNANSGNRVSSGRGPIIESSNTACSGSNCVFNGNGNNGGVPFPPMPLMSSNQASSNVQVSNKPISIIQSSSSNDDVVNAGASSGRRPIVQSTNAGSSNGYRIESNYDSRGPVRFLPPLETPEWLKTRGARSAGAYV